MDEQADSLRNRAAYFRNPDYKKSGFPAKYIEPLGAELEAAAAEIDRLRTENERLRERERRCPTMLESEARALVRALQEMAGALGLDSNGASPSQTVETCRNLRARVTDLERGRDMLMGALDVAEAENERLRKENRILSIKARGTLANNLCPDHRDKQEGKPCLACEVERLESEKMDWQRLYEKKQDSYDALVVAYNDLKAALEGGSPNGPR